MATDNIEWPAAREKFVTIMRNNRQGLFVATLPYKIGIFTAVSAGLLSIPLIFHLETVLLFNENFVTTGQKSPYSFFLIDMSSRFLNLIVSSNFLVNRCTRRQRS